MFRLFFAIFSIYADTTKAHQILTGSVAMNFQCLGQGNGNGCRNITNAALKTIFEVMVDSGS
ncbi:hypothetical protein SAMN04487890_11251 [Mucilaginibacter polytrichastri]|nr:hypothetical protein SAMN04487890_11251 [Mucilaginibacter polytrichastri]